MPKISQVTSVGVAALLLAAGAGAAFAQAMPERQTLMAAPCAATGGERCAARVAESVAHGQPFALTMLLGCQAELTPAAPGGIAAIEAAQDAAAACMAAAVHGGTRLANEELLAGQQALRRRPEFKGQTDGQVADTLRARLVEADTKCGRIAHKYTRYTCYSQRLAALAPAKS